MLPQQGHPVSVEDDRERHSIPRLTRQPDGSVGSRHVQRVSRRNSEDATAVSSGLRAEDSADAETHFPDDAQRLYNVVHAELLVELCVDARARRLQRDKSPECTSAAAHLREYGHELEYGCCA